MGWRLVIASCVALVACAAAPPVFGLGASDGHHSSDLVLYADGRWTWTSNAGGGRSDRGRIGRVAMLRFRALLQAARFELLGPPCDGEPPSLAESVALADHERGRYLRYVEGCHPIDDATARLWECLRVLRHHIDDDAACRLPDNGRTGQRRL